MAGLVAQALLLGAICALVPPMRRLVTDARARFWALLASGLGSHLLLDALNVYGVHPFHPLGSRWYYGDAVFIAEPWLWVLLGMPLAWDPAGRPVRLILVALVAALVALTSAAGIVPPGAMVAMAAGALLLAAATRRLHRSSRPLVAVVAASAFVFLLLGLSGLARARARSALDPAPGVVLLDVMLNPNPANPLCWAVIAVEKTEARDEYTLRRAALSLVPSWQAPTDCVSYRLAASGPEAAAEGGGIAWVDMARQSLTALRSRAAEDCHLDAWMRFGRAPLMRDGTIRDLRFETGRQENFTAMTLVSGDDPPRCPPYVPGWGMPRADLLAR